MTDAKEGIARVARSIREDFLRTHLQELSKCEPLYLETALGRRWLPDHAEDVPPNSGTVTLCRAAKSLKFPSYIGKQYFMSVGPVGEKDDQVTEAEESGKIREEEKEPSGSSRRVESEDTGREESSEKMGKE